METITTEGGTATFRQAHTKVEDNGNVEHPTAFARRHGFDCGFGSLVEIWYDTREDGQLWGCVITRDIDVQAVEAIPWDRVLASTGTT